jgi:hypothetical protein
MYLWTEVMELSFSLDNQEDVGGSAEVGYFKHTNWRGR